MDPTTFVEMNFLFHFFIRANQWFFRFRVCFILTASSNVPYINEGWNIFHALKCWHFFTISFCLLLIPISHSMNQFLCQLQRKNMYFTLWILTTYKLASFQSSFIIQCIILCYILQCWGKGNDRGSMKALVLLLSSWVTSHWGWGFACLWSCCKSLYSSTYFDFEWLFLVGLILFLINLR